jgi:hypothetical protein
MNARVRGWLSLALYRLAAGASPVDGFHGAHVQDRQRARNVPAQAPVPSRPGQTQFVRGLS